MKSENKTKTQLLDEVDQLRRLLADLEASETALRESEAKFHQLFDTSHDVIVFLGREGNIIDINRRAEELTHYARTELLQMDEFQDLIVPEDRALMRRVVKDAFEGRESRYVERWRTKEGEIICFDGLTVPRRSARGEVVSTFCTLRDITEHKMADDALRESEEKFNKIVNSALDGILIAHVESKKFIFGNKAICRMLDYAPEDITKLSVHDIHPESELSHVLSQFEMQAKGVIDIAEDIPVKRKDGSVFYADISSSPVVFGDREYLVGIFRDITERKRQEEEINNRIKELEDFYRMAVGRELRMKELKEEISRLKEELEKCKKH
jgi:PAS domain S-box-containing protein